MLQLDRTLKYLKQTPVFIYDENSILHYSSILKKIKSNNNFKVLFALKSFCILDGIKIMSWNIDGYACSSLFEVKLADGIRNDDQILHLTTPAIKPNELDQFLSLCDFINLNSLAQLKNIASKNNFRSSLGLRINPQISFVKDKRYDPCRKYSKLGVPLNSLSQVLKSDPESLSAVEGILVHSNCESEDLSELKKTVLHIENEVPGLFYKLKWINLGGGYLFETSEDLQPLGDLVSYLNNKYDIEIFFEPGKAIIGNAGYIVSTVLDLFESDGKTIAVLDTTVNHMPEVFEYQYKPQVFGTTKNSKYKYILAGCTCLSGDLFGEYCFNEPLEIGSKVIFENVGAYTLVKAHMFNGVNLPDIYALNLEGKLELKKRHTYEEFLQRLGGCSYEAKRKAVVDSKY